nr:DUF1345 domain-containing protein [Leucobacter weissii]
MPRTRLLGTVVVVFGEALGLLVQFLLVWIGVEYLFTDDGDEAESLRLLLWCMIATLYLSVTALLLSIGVRVRGEDPPALRRLRRNPLIRWISMVVTFSSSLVGLSAAITLILMRSDPDHLMFYELTAVWAMLVSWALFHWGYARIYYSRYYRLPGKPPMVFPGTETPRQVDFAYFAFTNGTTFGVTDVQVIDSHMRWTVVWHTTFGFFFNALIIVLTMNTISGGLQGV